MRALVTRPQPQADEWVARLRAAGIQAAALPLIEIAPPTDDAPVRAAWQHLDRHALVMFVSPNAAASFFRYRPAGRAWPAQVLAGATGPGTAAALLAQGVPESALVQPPADAARFDSEALWAQLAGTPRWQGAEVLVVRGEEGRDWFAQTASAAGATVNFVSAYRRCPPRWAAAQQALLGEAVAAPAAHLWLFSSSEAIGHLRAHAPGVSWQAAQAGATHPRIAESARAAGFGRVLELPPTLAGLLAAWPSIQSPAP